MCCGPAVGRSSRFTDTQLTGGESWDIVWIFFPLRAILSRLGRTFRIGCSTVVRMFSRHVCLGRLNVDRVLSQKCMVLFRLIANEHLTSWVVAVLS